MTDTIQTLHERMEAAAAALDFEEARRLRDRISLMRGGATAAEAEQADLSGLKRQRPGAMGLGTSQQRVEPPAGWKRPSGPADARTKLSTSMSGRLLAGLSRCG
jgi:hypothetical protein